jgi:hypothetical protein
VTIDPQPERPTPIFTVPCSKSQIQPRTDFSLAESGDGKNPAVAIPAVPLPSLGMMEKRGAQCAGDRHIAL